MAVNQRAAVAGIIQASLSKIQGLLKTILHFSFSSGLIPKVTAELVNKPVHNTGFIQADLSKIQGLFKNFQKPFLQFFKD